MSKELIEQAHMFAGDPILGAFAEEAADALESQAREIDRLIIACADHVTVRSEQRAEIEELKVKVSNQSDWLVEWNKSKDENKELRAEVESLHRRFEDALTLNEPEYKELRAALVDAISVLNEVRDGVGQMLGDTMGSNSETYYARVADFVEPITREAITRCREVLK